MAKVRKDLRGRSLRKGEVQRSSDKRYMYTYTDPMGRRKFIYANDLAELREKEAKLMKDQLDGLDLYVAGKASVNDTFDRYMSTKYNLRESTKSSYLYTYDHYVRDTFGYRDAETSFLQDPLSVSEISLIKSYREHKEMQPAVHKLLDLPAPVTRTRRKRKPKKSNPEV